MYRLNQMLTEKNVFSQRTEFLVNEFTQTTKRCVFTRPYTVGSPLLLTLDVPLCGCFYFLTQSIFRGYQQHTTGLNEDRHESTSTEKDGAPCSRTSRSKTLTRAVFKDPLHTHLYPPTPPPPTHTYFRPPSPTHE